MASAVDEVGIGATIDRNARALLEVRQIAASVSGLDMHYRDTQRRDCLVGRGQRRPEDGSRLS